VKRYLSSVIAILTSFLILAKHHSHLARKSNTRIF
jgi:hypothetical protein